MADRCYYCNERANDGVYAREIVSPVSLCEGCSKKPTRAEELSAMLTAVERERDARDVWIDALWIACGWAGDLPENREDGAREVEAFIRVARQDLATLARERDEARWLAEDRDQVLVPVLDQLDASEKKIKEAVALLRQAVTHVLHRCDHDLLERIEHFLGGVK